MRPWRWAVPFVTVTPARPQTDARIEPGATGGAEHSVASEVEGDVVGADDQPVTGARSDMLEDLGVTRSLSRPRVSNDNPFSEANFKTAKYRPDYPARFDNIDHARTWMRRFAHWYNHVHYHSGIGHLHPADVHHGTAGATVAARQTILDRAYTANPERFRNQRPRAAKPPAVAWINKPTIHTQT